MSIFVSGGDPFTGKDHGEPADGDQGELVVITTRLAADIGRACGRAAFLLAVASEAEALDVDDLDDVCDALRDFGEGLALLALRGESDQLEVWARSPGAGGLYRVT